MDRDVHAPVTVIIAGAAARRAQPGGRVVFSTPVRATMAGVWGTEPELLVVLDLPGIRAEVRAEVRAALAAIGPVTATLDPRLALVAAPASRVSEVAAIPGVRGVFTDEVPPALRETFGVGECLFVDGWLARKAEKHRDPPDGEPWDAPGRLPPDPPPGFPPGRRPGPRPG